MITSHSYGGPNDYRNTVPEVRRENGEPKERENRGEVLGVLRVSALHRHAQHGRRGTSTDGERNEHERRRRFAVAE